MVVDYGIVTAIMTILGIGLIGIIQVVKEFLHAEGLGGWAIAFILSFVASAVVLLQAGLFTPLALIVYGLIAFGEATGLYRVYTKEG